MKTRPVLIALMLSLILWAIGLYSCAAAPGAAEAPGLSRIGTSKVFDPHPQNLHFQNSQHICFVPEWDQAGTNSWIDQPQRTGSQRVNTKEYSELDKMRLVYNLYYVKYKTRNRTFFGQLTVDSCGAGSDSAHEIVMSKLGIMSYFGVDSQIGKFVFSMTFVSIATKVSSADRPSKRKVLTV